MPQPIQRNVQNHILSQLSPEDFCLLSPKLEPVVLRVPKLLEVPNKPIELIYFMERGIASLVANGSGGRSMEMGSLAAKA
jgi:hypothetical protein